MKKVRLLLNTDQGNLDKIIAGNPNMIPLDIAKKIDYPLANLINDNIVKLLSPVLTKVNMSFQSCGGGGGGKVLYHYLNLNINF